MITGELAPKHGYLQEIRRERALLETRSRSGLIDLVEDRDLSGGENAVGRSLRVGAFRHGDKVDAPAYDRDEGKELRQSFGSFEPHLLGTAAGLHDLVEYLRLPTQRIPAELLDCPGEIIDLQIRHQLPVDRRAFGWRLLLDRMGVCQNPRAIVLLLAHRRQGFDGGELHHQPSRLVLANRNAMTARPRCRNRLGKNAMIRTAQPGMDPQAIARAVNETLGKIAGDALSGGQFDREWSVA